MENIILLICFSIFVSFVIFYLSDDQLYKSHETSPVSGEKTQITACLHDPYFNSGFVVSLASIEELRQIQSSLKKADKRYVIRDESGDFVLINNIHKREQIIKKCSYKVIKELMEKNLTSIVDYSV